MSTESIVRKHAILADDARPLTRAVFEAIDADARFVLIGEASHGTHDFYRHRAEVTRMLIEERGFNAVVAEADFPDAFRVNMYVRGMGTDRSADEALGDFKRFPTWMWRNSVMLEFVEGLRRHNIAIPADDRGRAGVGFYGMDMYSLHASMAKVVQYLDTTDPELAKKVRERYKCFDRFGADAMAYAHAVGVGGARPCTEGALATLRDVSARAAGYIEAMDGWAAQEGALQAKANAAVVANAESYYRQMMFGDELTWNIRDRAFLSTVEMLVDHLGCRVPKPKLVLWAHNSHLGDARATDMGQRRGEVNIGQLMRELYGHAAVVNVGFTTYTGSVSAADEWDSHVLHQNVRPGMPGSYEALLHRVGHPQFLLDFRHGAPELRSALEGPMLERAIGVIYRPRTERHSHYFHCSLPRQFDLLVHLDTTRALVPLEPPSGCWEESVEAREDAPETWPFAV